MRWLPLLLMLACAPKPQPQPPLGGSPRDSVRVIAEREAQAFAARAEAIATGQWRLVSVGQFARIAAWWRSEPFWTLGLPITQTGPAGDCVYSFTDGDGANLGRRYVVLLFDQEHGDLPFAKYHHGTDVLTAQVLDFEAVQQ